MYSYLFIFTVSKILYLDLSAYLSIDFSFVHLYSAQFRPLKHHNGSLLELGPQHIQALQAEHLDAFVDHLLHMQLGLGTPEATLKQRLGKRRNSHWYADHWGWSCANSSLVHHFGWSVQAHPETWPEDALVAAAHLHTLKLVRKHQNGPGIAASSAATSLRPPGSSAPFDGPRDHGCAPGEDQVVLFRLFEHIHIYVTICSHPEQNETTHKKTSNIYCWLHNCKALAIASNNFQKIPKSPCPILSWQYFFFFFLILPFKISIVSRSPRCLNMCNNRQAIAIASKNVLKFSKLCFQYSWLILIVVKLFLIIFKWV